jgi:hypothetical protein
MTSQLSLKLPADLKQSLEADAQMLGISISAAARIRLRTGSVPSVHQPKAPVLRLFEGARFTR